MLASHHDLSEISRINNTKSVNERVELNNWNALFDSQHTVKPPTFEFNYNRQVVSHISSSGTVFT